MRDYLIIANQTLGGAELQQEIRRRSRSEPSEFFRQHHNPTSRWSPLLG